jgi:hypothetical protein
MGLRLRVSPKDAPDGTMDFSLTHRFGLSYQKMTGLEEYKYGHAKKLFSSIQTSKRKASHQLQDE